MYKRAIAILVSAYFVGAQETDNDLYHPHAAFAFIRTGERTPVLGPGQQILTALGAQQMHKLGQNFRTRYITGNTNAGIGVQHIAGMSQDTLNNNQVLVQSTDQQHLVSSAQAFMQGLYPPRNIGNGTASTGGLLANGSAIDYPLGGYQYANIQSSGRYDPESIYMAGTQDCPVAIRDSLHYFSTPEFAKTQGDTKELYGKLNTDWFEGRLTRQQIEYTNAIEISEYLQYQYAHNSSIYRTLANDSSFTGVYDRIRTLADEEAWYIYGNTSTSSTDADNKAIAGKTLASIVLGAFQRRIVDQLSPGDKNDISYPLTLIFGEFEPFISLLSLMMVDHRDPTFKAVPAYGSALIFELFSRRNTSDFPTNLEDLWVRFSFHNGSAYDGHLTSFPIFGNGPSRTDVMWSEFQDMFSRVMIGSLKGWCDTCQSSSLFCWGVDDEGSNTLRMPDSRGKGKTVSPAVGGVIGAIVTLVVAGLLFGLAMLFAGIRIHRVERSKKSELGGFKGSRKLASDPDLSLADNGALPAGISFVPGDSKRGHERVGSWELRQKEVGADLADRSRRSSVDGIDAIATRPVQVDERV